MADLLCAEQHDQVICALPVHPYGHHVSRDGTVWEGLPYPDKTRHGVSRVTEVIAGIGDRGRKTGPPRATRSSDPGTSHQAAMVSVESLRKSQSQVHQLFVDYGPMCDEVLLEVAGGRHIQQSVSGLRTRRKELVEYGLLRDTGERRKTASGRDTIVWGLV